MKKIVQQCIRSLHLQFFWRELPSKIALYLHSIESSDYNCIRAMVTFFKDLGYRFCRIEEILVDDDEKKVYLSFDDNYRAWYLALGLFDQLDIQATFYVNSLPFRDKATHDDLESYFRRIDHHGVKESLSTNEVKEIAACGHVIGGHTHSHLCLSKLDTLAAQKEISINKAILEDILGRNVEHFSYPFGMRRHFNRSLREFCLSLGFKTIVTGIPSMQIKKVVNGNVHRSPWQLTLSVSENIDNICVDGRVFERLTGKSPVG